MGGFTLVEILVVVGIVAILATILMAVFVRVREKSRASICQSNLKQIALAVQQYAHDNDGRFPSVIYVMGRNTPAAKQVAWNEAIMTYAKAPSIFSCPSSEINEPSLDIYAYNSRQLNDIIWSPNRNPRFNQIVGSHESKILTPATVALNFDTWAQHANSIENGATIETSCGPHSVATLHSGGANYSYLDGHVKWLSQSQQAEAICARLSSE